MYTRRHAETYNAATSTKNRSSFDYRCPEFNVKTRGSPGRLPCAETFIIGQYRLNVSVQRAVQRGAASRFIGLHATERVSGKWLSRRENELRGVLRGNDITEEKY